MAASHKTMLKEHLAGLSPDFSCRAVNLGKWKFKIYRCWLLAAGCWLLARQYEQLKARS